MSQQAFYDGFPWTIHRNVLGWPRWWQRCYEAWLVITGRYTFWHAWHDGKHQGSMSEYRRIIINGGDLHPILLAAVEVTYHHAMEDGISPDVACHLTAKAWQHYRDTTSNPLQERAHD